MGSSRVGSNPTRSDKATSDTFPSWQRKATIKKMKRLGICQPLVVHDPFFMQATQGTESVAAEIAQLGERQTEDLKVPGSIPGRGIGSVRF